LFDTQLDNVLKEASYDQTLGDRYNKNLVFKCVKIRETEAGLKAHVLKVVGVMRSAKTYTNNWCPLAPQ
jgi:hypothetical protein